MDGVGRVEERKAHVVFIPFPAQSHIKCMLKLARLLHHKGISITFINTRSNQNRLVKSGGTHGLHGAPDFEFKTVPDSPSSGTDDGVQHTPTFSELKSYLETNFSDSFVDLVSGLETPITCIVFDGYMAFTNTLYAAEKLKINVILFWTVSTSGFMGSYQVKVLMEKGLVPLKDESYLTNGYLDMEIDWIPGMEGIRLKDLPEFMRATKLNDTVLRYFMDSAHAADKVSHTIIHTFEELEPSLLKEIKSILPAEVYTIGPLQMLINQMKLETETSKSVGYSLWKEEPECVQWLQSKKPNSVLYVNFGSLAVMSIQDLVELGWGLVNSDSYFLWIIRADLIDGKPAVLPQELEEAIKSRVFIAGWCSQEEVLNHPSVGGFLTHGGWGSIIESLSVGVPMICWPFIGEQQTNCRQMCKQWGVGMEIGKNVKRDQVEKLVKELMEGEEGKAMRKKAIEWKKLAEMATSSHGSSFLDLEKLANQIFKFSSN